MLKKDKLEPGAAKTPSTAEHQSAKGNITFESHEQEHNVATLNIH